MNRSLVALTPLFTLISFAACGTTGPSGTSASATGSGGGASSSSTSSSTGSGGVGGASSSSTSASSSSGNGGSGGSGGQGGSGGSGACQDNTTQPCYTGPSGTEGQGICQSGLSTCQGGVWGPCQGDVTPMMETCNGLDDDCDSATDEGCEPPWGKSFGPGTLIVRDMARDDVGNLYLTGLFSSPANFGGGQLSPKSFVPDGFVVKLSPAGAHLWSMRFGGIYADHGYGISVRGGSVFVTGKIDTSMDVNANVDFGPFMIPASVNYSDAFVAKLDAMTGTTQWIKVFGAYYGAAGNGVAADANGGVVVTGRVGDDMDHLADFGGGPLMLHGTDDIFLMKLDSMGNHVWSFTYGAGSNDAGYRVAIDGGGNVILAGKASGAIDLGGGVLPGMGFDGAILAKYDSNGAHLWSRTFVGSQGGNGQLAAAAVGPNDDVYVCGPMSAPVDFGGGAVPNGAPLDVFLAKYTAAGSYVWGVARGGAASGGCQGLSVDMSGDALLAGYTGTLADHQTWLASFTAGGTKAWETTFTSTGVSKNGAFWAAYGVAPNRAVVAGSFSGTLDLGSAGMLMQAFGEVGVVGLVDTP